MRRCVEHKRERISTVTTAQTGAVEVENDNVEPEPKSLAWIAPPIQRGLALPWAFWNMAAPNCYIRRLGRESNGRWPWALTTSKSLRREVGFGLKENLHDAAAVKLHFGNPYTSFTAVSSQTIPNRSKRVI